MVWRLPCRRREVKCSLALIAPLIAPLGTVSSQAGCYHESEPRAVSCGRSSRAQAVRQCTRVALALALAHVNFNLCYQYSVSKQKSTQRVSSRADRASSYA